MKNNILSIIVTYNAERNNWIRKCLNSLLKSKVKTDIIVIDNHSTDNTTTIIKTEYPQVNLIKAKENLGFGKANNIGLSKFINEDYQFAFLLNQDAWIESNVIEKLTEVSKTNPDYGIISPLHLNGNGDCLDWNFDRSASYKLCPKLSSDAILNKITNKVYSTEFVPAACWLLTRNCIQKVGGFNPSFYHYAEDDNYIHRVHFKKLKLGIYPHVKIYHDRENRKPDSKFWNISNIERNKYLINLSKPDRILTTNNVLEHIRALQIKAIIKMDFKKFKRLKNDKDYFIKNKKTIEKNFIISITEDCAFLKKTNN